MSKNDKLYYFKFDASIWLQMDSKVQLLNHFQKGVFIDLCAMCLRAQGYIDINDDLRFRLRLNEQELNDVLEVLCNKRKIVHIENGKLSIDFILDQIKDMLRTHDAMSKGGKKGGKKNEAKNKPPLSHPSSTLKPPLIEKQATLQVPLSHPLDEIKGSSKELELKEELELEIKEVLIQEKTPEDIQLEEANERLKAKRKAIEESRNPKTLEYSKEERTFTYQNNNFNFTTILANKFVDAMFKARLTEYLTWYCQTFKKLPNQLELDISLMQLAQNYTCYDAMLILQRNMKPDRKKIDIRDYESVTHRNRIEDEDND